MKKLIAFLLFLIAALQYRLWRGDGGIWELYQVRANIEALRQEGERRHARNAALEADVMDLKEGTDAIEERARRELGMVKEGETFVQVFEKPKPEAAKSEVPQPEASKPEAPKSRTAKGDASKPRAAKPPREQAEPAKRTTAAISSGAKPQEKKLP